MTLAEILGPLVGAEHVLGPQKLSLRNPGWCAESLDAGLLVRPADAAELSAVLKATPGVAVVAQGGVTGLVEGTASAPGEIIVSFERMNRIEQIDPAQGVALVGAGVTLAQLDAALEPHGLMAGVDIGARDSCTIGGMVSTNAGGIRVLRYGMMRASVLGLEVVRADGTVLDLTSPLMKNNAGYDLKQVFIGSEGTLGLVTKVALRLFPRPRAIATALLGIDPQAMSDFMPRLRLALGDALAALEGMWPDCYRRCAELQSVTPLPVEAGPDGPGLFLIVEAFGTDDGAAQSALAEALVPMMEDGTIRDAVLAQSGSERDRIWRIREGAGVIGGNDVPGYHYDVSLKLADLDPYVQQLQARVAAEFTDISVLVFGHVGDGNLHLSLMLDGDIPPRPAVDAVVYGVLAGFEGSAISAEHGVGLEKRAALQAHRPAEVLATMRMLKAAFDPEGRLNPGKVLG